VNPPRPANVRLRIARAAGAALASLAPACSSPLGGRDLDLSLAAQALPGAGASVAVAQKMVESGSRRIDFELGIERQKLSDAGPGGDDWSRLYAGLRCAALESGAGLQGRLGVNWLRNEGQTSALDPGDYGGAYVGAGWSFALTPALATGPEATFIWVDSEGDASGSGALAELAWRFTWHL